MLRSRILRSLGDTVLVHIALRADHPLDAATRLTLEHLLTEALGSPVEVRDPSVEVRAIPTDGAFAATLMGSALHAFSGARRPSAARMRHLQDEYAPASPHRSARALHPLGEDDEG